MELTVKRTYKGAEYTIGHLYVDGVYFCDTLEDRDRGLRSTMSEYEISKKKVYGKTAIPTGRYCLSLDVVSPKYSNTARYPYAAEAKGKMPRVLGVKGFDGILIHAGNSAEDTFGCLLVGENRVKGRVVNSQATWKRLYRLLKGARGRSEPLMIEYR